MRDAMRIARTMVTLTRLWHAYPDLRLGQLLLNLGGMGSTYYMEDDEMERRIYDVLNNGWPAVRHGSEAQEGVAPV